MRPLGPLRRTVALVFALFLSLQGGSNAVCDALYHAAADGHGRALTHVVHISPSDRGHRGGGDDGCLFCQALNHFGFLPSTSATPAVPVVHADNTPPASMRALATQTVANQHRARAPPYHSLLTA